MNATPATRASHTRPPGPAGAGLRLLVVDSQPVVRLGLAEVFRTAFGAVGFTEAGDVDAALAALEQGPYQLLMADVEIVGGSGLELTKQVRARWPEVCVLLFSGHDEKLFAQRALAAGASGYVMKQEEPSVLVEAVRTVLAGKLYVSSEVRRQFVRGLAGQGEPSSPVELLSDRELEVFAYLGRGLTRGEVARALNLSVKTVESYRARIKQKLGLESATMLLRTAVYWVNQEGSQSYTPPVPERAVGRGTEPSPALAVRGGTG